MNNDKPDPMTLTITKNFPNGDTLTLEEYLDVVNYGTDIFTLKSMNWADDATKARHISSVFGIHYNEAEAAIKEWRGY